MKSPSLPVPRRIALSGVVLVLALSACTAPSPGSGSSPAVASSADGADGADVADSTVVTGLTTPWAVGFLPGGGALVTERDAARVLLVADGSAREVAHIDAARPAGEGGLLGIAISPRFTADHRVFLYYTGQDDNRIASYRYDDGGLTDPRVILSGLRKNTTHNGGRIAFGPDGYLYVGTGDAQDRAAPQDPHRLNGKILRITTDGRPAPGNPFDGASGDGRVWSLGHRNVQGLAWDPAGRMWATEFGPDVDDEVNLIRPGGNYGWPVVTGAPHRDGFVDAAAVWPHTSDASPSGAAVATIEGRTSLWTGGLRGQRLWQVPLDGDRAGTPVEHLRDRFGRLRDVAHAPDGSLWVLTNQDADSRIVTVTAR